MTAAKKVRRYAEGTKVSPEKSVEDLRRLATRYDADGFTFGMGPDGGSVMFRIDSVPLRYDVRFPTDGYDVASAEAEYARRWRVVLLRAKAQFEAWQADGDMSVARAFLANVMLPGGGTVGDVVDDGGIAGLADVAIPALGPVTRP